MTPMPAYWPSAEEADARRRLELVRQQVGPTRAVRKQPVDDLPSAERLLADLTERVMLLNGDD